MHLLVIFVRCEKCLKHKTTLAGRLRLPHTKPHASAQLFSSFHFCSDSSHECFSLSHTTLHLTNISVVDKYSKIWLGAIDIHVIRQIIFGLQRVSWVTRTAIRHLLSCSSCWVDTKGNWLKKKKKLLCHGFYCETQPTKSVPLSGIL